MVKALYYGIHDLEALDKNLEQKEVQHFLTALVRRTFRCKVEDITTLINPQWCLSKSPLGTLTGLKEAVESGAACNDAYHLTYTLLAIYMELEERGIDILEIIRSSENSPGFNGKFQKYCQRLINNAPELENTSRGRTV